MANETDWERLAQWGAAITGMLAPAVTFVLAAGLWNGEEWISLKQLWIFLFTAAGAESLTTVYGMFNKKHASMVQPFTPGAIRHWVLALMVFFTWKRLPDNTSAWALYDGDDDAGVVTNEHLRRLLRLYLVLGLCMADLFVHLVFTVQIINMRPAKAPVKRTTTTKPLVSSTVQFT
jgi:hypothetical protein